MNYAGLVDLKVDRDLVNLTAGIPGAPVAEAGGRRAVPDGPEDVTLPSPVADDALAVRVRIVRTCFFFDNAVLIECVIPCIACRRVCVELNARRRSVFVGFHAGFFQ